MNNLDASFKALLTDYVDGFIARVSSTSSSQAPIPIAPAFANRCEESGIWFKTSFGHGNLASIPWLACFVPGQSAQFEGVYPVLMYQRSTSIASVNYGASATAVEASGIWPRQWPEKLIAGLSPFALKKKEYKKSFVLQEFHSPLAPQVNEMTTAFLKVIQEFLVLQDALVHQTRFDYLAMVEFHEESNDAGLVFSQDTNKRLLGMV